jgi:hypothetical protein
MHDSWLIALLVQIFWLSFVAIGWAFLEAQQHLFPKVSHKLSGILTRAPLVVSLFVFFAIGMTLFTIPLTLAYIFEWRVVSIAALYSILVAVTLVILVLRFKPLARSTMQGARSLTRLQIILGCFLGVMAALLFASNLSVGGFLNDDVPIHLAKVQLYLNSGRFTLADPLLGYNGIIDLRYSTNILNGMQAVLASLLHVRAYVVWFYSIAVYQLLLVVSLIALAFTYLSKIPKIWIYASILLDPVFNGYVLREIELPHNYVLIWFSLLLIGLKLLLENGSGSLVLIAAALIATTHAVSASSVAAFFVLFLGLLILTKKVTRKRLIVLAAGFCLLSIPVIASVRLPNHFTQGTDYLTSDVSGLHARPVAVQKIGPVVLPAFSLRPSIHFEPGSISNAYSMIVYGVLAICIIVFRRIQNLELKYMLLWLMLAVVLARFNYLYFSIIGFIYIVKNTKDANTKALLLLTIFFFALIAYNPFVLTMIFGRVPLWLVGRFQDVNTFAFLVPYLGVFALYECVESYWHLTDRFHAYDVAVAMLFMSLILSHTIPLNIGSIISYGPGFSSRTSNRKDYSEVRELEKLDPYVKNQIILSDSNSVNRLMAIATQGEYIGKVYNSQSNQMQNTSLRSECYTQLLTKLAYADLRSAKVTRVIATSGPAKSSYSLDKLARTKPYLQFEKQIDNYRVYAVQPQPMVKGQSTVCSIPHMQ